MSDNPTNPAYKDLTWAELFGYRLIETNPATEEFEPSEAVLDGLQAIAGVSFGAAVGLGKNFLITAEQPALEVAHSLERSVAKAYAVQDGAFSAVSGFMGLKPENSGNPLNLSLAGQRFISGSTGALVSMAFGIGLITAEAPLILSAAVPVIFGYLAVKAVQTTFD